MPVYLQTLDAATAGNGWFSLWEKSGALPHRVHPKLGQPLNSFPTANAVSTVSLIDVGYVDYPLISSILSRSLLPPLESASPSIQFSRLVNGVLNNNRGAWSGLVLNFSDVSVDKALETINEISAAR